MIMKRLQRDTLDLHREVEALMPVMSEALTRPGYLEVLRRLQTVVVPLEAQLDTLPLPSGLQWPERRKAHLLARDLALPTPECGDLLAIGEAGAYGAAMSSNYLSRPRPAEVLWEGGEWRVLRRRERPQDLWAAEE